MKKYIKIVLCVSLIISMLVPTSAFAGESKVILKKTDKVTQDSSFVLQSDNSSDKSDILSDKDYEKVLSEIKKKAEESITPDLLKKVKDIRDTLNNSKDFQKLNDELKIDGGMIAPLASYDSVSLEALLCINDGLSATDIFKIGWTHANAARDEAIALYTDTSTEMKRDAFRHMTWNFRSLKDVGEHKTRVATINHEWAYKILPAVTQYEQQRYDYYFNLYYNQIILGLITVNDIMLMAKSDADAYAITYRDQLISSCKSSLAVFNSTFNTNAYIMDFWNNKVGRDYAKSNPTSTTNTVFTSAWNANKLIKNETSSAVTSTVRSTVHNSNWWYIW